MRYVRRNQRAIESHQTVERAIGLARSAHGVLWSGNTEGLKGVRQWSSVQAGAAKERKEVADQEEDAAEGSNRR